MPALPHHRRIAILAVTASAFALLAIAVAGDSWVVRADNDVALWLRTHSSEPLVDASRMLTYLGSTLALAPLAVVAAAVAWRAGRRDDCLLLVRAVAGAELLFWSLKAIVQRPRPVLPDPLATATSFSFPSGHVTMATAVWGALALVVARRNPNWRVGVAAFATASLLVLIVACTRLYLGVHFLSDVVAGALLGAGWLALLLLWEDRTTWWRPAAASTEAAAASHVADDDPHVTITCGGAIVQNVQAASLAVNVTGTLPVGDCDVDVRLAASADGATLTQTLFPMSAAGGSATLTLTPPA